MTHICVSKLTIFGSDNSLSPGRRQAIIWTNAGILLTGLLGINFSEILIEIHTSSFKKMRFKMSSGKWRPFVLGLNVLTPTDFAVYRVNWASAATCFMCIPFNMRAVWHMHKWRNHFVDVVMPHNLLTTGIVVDNSTLTFENMMLCMASNTKLRCLKCVKGGDTAGLH